MKQYILNYKKNTSKVISVAQHKLGAEKEKIEGTAVLQVCVRRLDGGQM